MNRIKYLISSIQASYWFSNALDLAAEGRNLESLEFVGRIPDPILAKGINFFTLHAYSFSELGDIDGLKQSVERVANKINYFRPSHEQVYLGIYVKELSDLLGIENKIISEVSQHECDYNCVLNSVQRNFPLDL